MIDQILVLSVFAVGWFLGWATSLTCSLRPSSKSKKPKHRSRNAHAELKVDNCIGEVETSNVNAHSGLRLWDSGCGVRLGDSVPRLRVFFVDSGCDK
jgi:hypothetical protein